ncbi:RBBP9/YdeN family alpha/beta hydrolase [Sphingopyxis sp. R3-92]|uniref:RBBP9/YdeN family alpha/beta hydrolase n=1 Tax=Sphingopyxis sp. R3-92 TaxID=3158553 RepID=UPI003EE7D01B
MHDATIRHKILTIPGLNNSGPAHWQSLWEHKFFACERVELGHWDEPDKEEWVRQISAAIDAEDEPVLIAAHSLGCHAFAHWFSAAGGFARSRIAGALLVAPPDLSQLRHVPRVASFADVPSFTSRTPTIVVASDNDSYAKTAHVWRLSRQWDARFVNAGPFGHINADSGIGDWPYGQYLLASLQPVPTPALADEAQWLRTGDWPNRFARRDSRFEYKESAHRS